MQVAPRALMRLGWSVADQALTSIANFALAAFIARMLGPTEFGAFTIAFTAYLLVLGLARSVATQPLLVRFSYASPADWRRGASMAAGVVLVFGVLGGLACVIAAWPADDTLGEALFIVGLMLPGLLLWDIWRYAFFAAGRGRLAFTLDGFLVTLLVIALGGIALSGSTSLIWPVLAWGGTATLTGIAASALTKVLPRPLLARSWWREQSDIGLRYAAEVAADMSAGLLSYNVVAVAAGLAGVGALRAAQLVLGPLNIVLLGIPFVAIAEGARMLKRSRAALRNGCLLLSAALVCATVLWGAASLAAPESLGLFFLGSSWGPARSVLLPSVVAVAGSCMTVGAWVGLRALAAARESLRVRVAHSVALLICVLVGVVANGTEGAAWGTAVAAWFGATVWWLQFHLSLDEHMRSSSREPAGDAAPGAV